MAKLNLKNTLDQALKATKSYVDTELAKKANSSHGTHVTYGGNGSASTVSRSDHTHSYLPLGGGTMTGAVKFSDVTSTTYPAKSSGLSWNGSTDGADIYYQVDAADKGRLVLNTRDDVDCIIAFANAGTIKTTIDNSGNFSGTAANASKVANSIKVQLNGGTTEGTNQFTFNGSAAKTINITPASIGAAASSHGTHVTYSTSTPAANGTASAGSANNVARGDHVHPLQTTVSGNAGTATKLATARSITIGNKANNFDGSGNISYTLADMGATETVAWDCSIKCATWSRLFQFSSSNATTGGTYLVNIRATRSSVVYNPTLLVNFSHSNKFKVVQLNNTDYSNIKVRGVVDGNGAGYFEMYDNVNSATSSTTQTVSVTVTKISSGLSITKYTAFTTGATVPSGYTAVGEFTTVSGTYYSGTAASANKVNKSLSIQLNGTLAAAFDGSVEKTINITPSSIGAAASSHGTHVTYSTSAPAANGTASAGSAANVARGDHVHPLQTTVSGNAGTATKLKTARTLTIGNTGKTFDGSANVSWSLAEIGAIPLTGNPDAYSITGNLTFSDAGTSGGFKGVVGKCGANDYWRVGGLGVASNDGRMEIATSDDGNEPIYVRQYTGVYSTLVRTATLLDSNGNTSFPGSVTVGDKAQLKYNATSESLDFIFI